MPPRIIFMGTPQFSVAPLKALLENAYHVVAVYTQPPRPAGRGYDVVPSPVHEFAKQHHIPVYTPDTLKTAEELAKFQDLKPDLAIVVAYGMILSRAFLEIPVLGCLNIHASLLPQWRGAAPIQRCIMAGDKESGVALMKMDEGVDTGPVIAMAPLSLSPHMTSGKLFELLADLGARTLIKYLPDYMSGNLKPMPQSAAGSIIAKKIKKEEAQLDFKESAVALERKIRGLNPFPGAYFNYHNMRIKVLEATLTPGPLAASGTIVDEQFGVACGEGVLYPKILQKPGGKVLPIETFLNGFSFNVGDRLNDPAAL
ncbi:MAG: methionyl-tRNA formyltransferase [Alphaproteobacteria bacterium]